MSIRFIVKKVLRQSAVCRDDDRMLIAKVTEICPGASPATVIRYRAVYQNKDNLFPPTRPEVAKRRNRHKPK